MIGTVLAHTGGGPLWAGVAVLLASAGILEARDRWWRRRRG